jgi:hypothetical protein
MLFLCPRAKKVWQNLGLDLKIMEACATDLAGQAVLEYLLCSEQPTVPFLVQTITAQTYAVAGWYLWWERRQAVNGKQVQPESRSAMAISSLVANYRAAHTPRAKPKKVTRTKPPLDSVRVDVDASFDADNLRGTIGAVVRDYKGHFIAACIESSIMCLMRSRQKCKP